MPNKVLHWVQKLGGLFLLLSLFGCAWRATQTSQGGPLNIPTKKGWVVKYGVLEETPESYWVENVDDHTAWAIGPEGGMYDERELERRASNPAPDVFSEPGPEKINEILRGRVFHGRAIEFATLKSLADQGNISVMFMITHGRTCWFGSYTGPRAKWSEVRAILNGISTRK